MNTVASTRLRYPIRFVLVALSYYIAGLVGLSVPYIDSHITLIWAPTGIALAALLRWQLSLWPAIALGAFAVNFEIGSPPLLAVAIALGNTLGPWLAALALQRLRFDTELVRRRDLSLYLLIGVVGGMLISASNGVLQLWLAGILPAAQLPAAGLTWWLGDAMGALVCGIPLLTLRSQAWLALVSQRKGLEQCVILLLILLTGAVIFEELPSAGLLVQALIYLPFFLLCWLAIRGGVWIASMAALLLSVQAIWATASGSGPFQSGITHFSLTMLWGYMATATIITVLITVLIGELHQSEARHRLLLGNSPVGILHYDPDLIVTYVNSRFAEIMAVPVEYMFGLDCNALRDQSVVPALNRALTGEPAHYEGAYITSYGGRALWISMRTAPVVDEYDRIIGGIAILEDITGRKKIEAELAKFKFFSDHASDMHYLLDRDGHVRYVNKMACERLGYTEQELLSLSVPLIDPNYEVDAVRAVFDRCKESWIEPFETVHRCKDGSLLPVEVTARAHNFNGEWLSFSAARDITERKQIEARERRQRANLAALNRIAALSHLPLAQQLHEALAIGSTQLSLEYGIVSQIEARNYRVVAHVSPPHTLQVGQCFELGSTYCQLTLQQTDVIAVSQWSESDYRGHPCYEAFGLQAYIGAPVRVAGEVYGTVNFSSPAIYTRDFDAGDREFVRLLAGWVGSVIERDQVAAQLKEQQQRLEYLAHYDPLTHLPNRTLLADRMTQALALAQRNGTLLSLCYLDLDGFKAVNDRLGHETGDALLVEIAARLNRVVRSADTVARLGGDEFVLLLVGVEGLDESERAVQRVLQTVAEPVRLGAELCQVSGSIGIAVYPQDGEDPDTLLRHADQAMYLAKHRGKSCHQFYASVSRLRLHEAPG